jgi:hypothetical protein
MVMVEPSGAERRAHARMPAARKIYIVDDPRSWKCSLLDVAEKGARLSTAGIAAPPDKFVFVDAGGRRVHLAHVVWRSGAEVGVQFLQTERMGPRAGGAAGALDIARRFAANLPPELLQ